MREPITVILSERGWIRAVKGKVEDPSTLTFKEGDALAFLVPCETTDKLMVFSGDGRAFTLACDKLPSGRGQGEPLRLMIELPDSVDVLAVFPFVAGRKRLLASKSGYGFVVEEDELVSGRKAGKQVMNGETGAHPGDRRRPAGLDRRQLQDPDLPCRRTAGDAARQGREAAELPRRRPQRRPGVRRRSRPTWIDASGRSRNWAEWREWAGRRGGSGKLAPRGFPANRRFRPR